LRRLLVCLAALLAGASCAQVAPPTAGRDYQVLEPARPTARGRIEVLEFFSYGCDVCYEAQPHIARWLQVAGPDVVLRRVAAVSNESWVPLARAYYALESLGELERLHQKLFDAQHRDGRQLDQEENLLAWLAANGVDPMRFKAARNSADTRRSIESSQRMGAMHRVRAVPTLVVAGRYAISAHMAGGVKEMLAVTQQLVERVREERAAR
jgi:protein dithiol oxidoreductase (disulfide-forming)